MTDLSDGRAGGLGGRLLRVSEAAEWIAVSVRTYYRLVQQRKLPPPVKVGRCSRVPEEDLVAFIQDAKDNRAR